MNKEKKQYKYEMSLGMGLFLGIISGVMLAIIFYH